ncbi:Isoquinoline 1-oxidoreductase subunit [uncultured Limimaricola sp.]|uniref:Isoquinoline 1-oxidoreductase subunit n=1 Tax=uncultured Limimaricola sp. TaxID=2211667 RepID=UPI0030F8DE80
MRATYLILAATILAAPATAQDLQGPEAFESIEDETARSQALFKEMAKVITHPRCMNCHPVGDRPFQGDDMRPHMPPVVRWDESGFGPPGLHCTSCHGSENVEFVGNEGGIPGHQPWHLPPTSMGWVGLSVGEICAQLKDPERNGDRSLAEIEEHNAEDGLVGWAWHPGKGRTPAPGTQAMFGDLTRAWIETGAACPT